MADKRIYETSLILHLHHPLDWLQGEQKLYRIKFFTKNSVDMYLYLCQE